MKAKIDALLADTKKTLENSGSSLDELKSAKDSLQKGFEELGQEVMKSGGMPEGAPGAGPAAGAEAPQDSEKKKDDDIVDADFEVVDDEKEKS